MKYVIFIPDGSSDYPLDELGGKTPLQAANTPHIDKLAKKGLGGFTNNVPSQFTPGSDVANMSIFGYNPEDYYTGRGPLEAASMNIQTSNNDVIFRCNIITQKNNNMCDFNAGHITSQESEILINDLNRYFNQKYDNFKGKFYPGISYRNLFVYSYDNEETANKISNLNTLPPHDIVGENLDKNTNWNDKDALFIKQIMWDAKEFLKDHEINKKRETPANMIWLWGQGRKPLLPDFNQTYGLKGAVITGVDLLKGIGIYAGLDIIEVPGATGFFDTNYKSKGQYAINALDDHDIVFIHIEAPDEAGHAGDIKEKLKAIENIDQYIVGPILDYLEGKDYKMAILPDHPTPIDVKTHTRDDVPVVMYSTTNPKSDLVEEFSEKGVEIGSIVKKDGYRLIERLINDNF